MIPHHPGRTNHKKPFVALILALVLVASAARAGSAPACKADQLDAYHPDTQQIAAHRRFHLPILHYPHGSRSHDKLWGLEAIVRVDRSGQVVCQVLKQSMDIGKVDLNPRRRTLLSRMASWRYVPFTRNHHPVAAVFSETIDEQEQPKTYRLPPSVPLNEVRITLERSSCYGTCPDYRVEVHGDGRVVFEGKRFVDVPGRHAYHVPVQDVAGLVKQLRALNIWSMASSYRAPITDQPGYTLILSFGKKTHRIFDYAGRMVGMPIAVEHFEDEVDRVSHSDQWIHLSQAALDHLETNGFAFRGQAGADLLSRAITDPDSHDEAAMQRLIKLGAPVHGGHGWWPNAPTASLVARAADLPRSLALVNALIGAGGLETGGHPDQNRIDHAFHAAISGGQLALVKRLWSVHGTKPHPALSYTDKSTGSNTARRVPVTLLLRAGYEPDPKWQGLSIARWLIAKGCDMNARGVDGRTLLQIAAAANDTRFIRYLLAHGANPSAPAEDDKPALEYAGNEDAALILLRAGTDLSRMPEHGRELLRDARRYHWNRVAEWLRAHHVPD